MTIGTRDLGVNDQVGLARSRRRGGQRPPIGSKNQSNRTERIQVGRTPRTRQDGPQAGPEDKLQREQASPWFMTA